MKEFINPFTKTSFFVADDRVEEYKAAGFPLAASSEEAKIEVEKPETEAEEITEEVIKAEKPEEVEEVKKPKKATKKAKK